MIAPAADQYRFQSGLLALLVHAAFFALLIFGITWQAKEPAGVVVDLWSNLPAPPVAQPVVKPVEPPPPAPEPVKKATPKPVPPAPVKAPDIALKDKRVQEEKRKQEQIKQEQLKLEQARVAEAARQQQVREDSAKRAQAQQAAAQQSIVSDYTGRIQSKIRSKLNRALCGDGKPQLEFDISLLPTGQLGGNPILRKGSGLAACDKAVENAILQAEPLPVPQGDALSFFRELHLKFKPNE